LFLNFFKALKLDFFEVLKTGLHIAQELKALLGVYGSFEAWSLGCASPGGEQPQENNNTKILNVILPAWVVSCKVSFSYIAFILFERGMRILTHHTDCSNTLGTSSQTW
jgi:hypothetical protein